MPSPWVSWRAARRGARRRSRPRLRCPARPAARGAGMRSRWGRWRRLPDEDRADHRRMDGAVERVLTGGEWRQLVVDARDTRDLLAVEQQGVGVGLARDRDVVGYPVLVVLERERHRGVRGDDDAT